MDVLLEISKYLVAILVGIVLGNGAVYFFNKIPPKWLTDYDCEISEELKNNDRQRIYSTPWKAIFTGLFVTIGIFLAWKDWQFAIPALIAIWVLLLISIADIKYMIIPDELIMMLAVVTIGFISYHDSIFQCVIGAAIGFGSMLFVGLLGKLIYKKDTLGGGDIKLIASVGFLTGPIGAVFTMVVSTFIGAIYFSLLLFLRQIKPKDSLPMGPHIAIATSIYIMFVW